MKKFLCSIMLVSMVMLTACGNSTDKATAAEPTDKEIEEAFEKIDAAEAASAEAAATSVSEYPSISKVTYDSLFSVIDKDELQQFATDYVYDNDSYKNVDNFEAKCLGSVFESLGVPGTDNYANLLMYVFKVTTNNEQKYAIHVVAARDISFVSEGQLSDITFGKIEEVKNLKDIYTMDKSQYEAMLSDSEQIEMTSFGVASCMLETGVRQFFDPKKNEEFYLAYADGTCEANYHIESDGFDTFMQCIHDSFYKAIDLRLENAYPDKVGKNTGTFSQH